MLHDLDDGLDAHACPSHRRLRLSRERARIVQGEHTSVADIHVMRNREHIAARSGIEASLGEPFPKLIVVGRVDMADWILEYDFVAEDHVAMEIRAEPEGAVFVGDEGRTFAGGVPARSCVLGLLPEPKAFRRAE